MSRSSNVSFLKPEHLAPIRNLNLRAKLIVEGMIAGLHRSPYHGFSAEFLEYRPYQQGESVRGIDWRKYARTDKAVVRLFEDETNLYARILVDKSASMDFKYTGGLAKLDYARTLAASLAWILIRQRDAVGIATFDDEVDISLPPRSTNVQLKTILSVLENLESGNRTRCGSAVNTVARTIRKRGLSVIISDLFDDADSVIQGLHHLRFKKQDVVVVRILDPFEMSFSSDSPMKIRDIENGHELMLDGRTAAEAYLEGFRIHADHIERACRELAVDYITITTDLPFINALHRVFEKRRRMQ